ncbi:MAG: hypothetical protein IIA62_01715 [Nitrospinae bacterium]|nr:hypothetical protein [Nitrospinota bacterium]
MSFVIREILIECRGCGVENIFNNYTPDMFLVCNQCRERLVEPDFCEFYKQYNCQDCGFTLFIKSSAEFKIGESDCRCGGTNIQQCDPEPFFKEAEKSAGLDSKIEPGDEGLGWYRSDSTSGGDYDDVFDDDPGTN